MVAPVVLDVEVAVEALGQRDTASQRSFFSFLCPSSCAVLIPTPATQPTVSARPTLSVALISKWDHAYAANTRPTYCSGRKAYVTQR